MSWQTRCPGRRPGRSKIKKFFRGPRICTVLPTEYTEWQRTLSGVHSILMEKSAQVGEGGGACPPLFTLFTFSRGLSSCGLQYSTPVCTL
jgi:hypothetical protein